MGYDIQPLTLELFPLAVRYVPAAAVPVRMSYHPRDDKNSRWGATTDFKYFSALDFLLLFLSLLSQGTIPYRQDLFHLQNVSTIYACRERFRSLFR